MKQKTLTAKSGTLNEDVIEVCIDDVKHPFDTLFQKQLIDGGTIYASFQKTLYAESN